MQYARRFHWLLFAVWLALLIPGAGAMAPASARPFNTVDRLDLNSADLYDFMDLPEVDFLRARALLQRREQTGEYQRLEDMLDILSPDMLNQLADVTEVGSGRSPRDRIFSGNSFTDLRWYFDRDSEYRYWGRYNVHFSNRIDARFAYSKGSAETNLNFDEVYVDYKNWSDGFFPANVVTVPRPEKEVHQRIVEGVESMEQRVLAEFDSRYDHELLIGRRRKKKVHGLFDTDLNSWQKYWVTKKKVETRRKQRPKPEPSESEPPRVTAEITLPERPLVPYQMKVPDAVKPKAVDSGKPVLRGVWSLGSVMLPRSLHPLIDLHRTEFLGTRYEHFFDNFRVAGLYQRSENRELESLGGHAYALFNEGKAVVGSRAQRLYHHDTDNDINTFSVYGIGDFPETNTHLYGEYQTVFQGASQLHGMISSHFRDLWVTTEILSIKEDYQGPNHVRPFTFDGEFTSKLRLTYNFSGISTIAAHVARSQRKGGEPDIDLGTTKESGARLFIKATEKSLLSLGYTRLLNLDGSWDDEYLARLRYRYKPTFHFYATSRFTDRDASGRYGRRAENSLDFRFKVKPYLKINFEIVDVWEEKFTNTEEEHETVGRINYYYNF